MNEQHSELPLTDAINEQHPGAEVEPAIMTSSDGGAVVGIQFAGPDGEPGVFLGLQDLLDLAAEHAKWWRDRGHDVGKFDLTQLS